ncbi:MAG: glycosyltransferase family 2 protein [Candidatus Eisenbacteria sp.]|nr:glycosyltransferase family 2 protein [Candidatus Eisenbacteria bacterium]
MSERLPISAILITLDEEDRLPRALASLEWVDQVVVVDAGSCDRTQEIARQAGAQVIEHPWEGYSEQKAFALRHAAHRWVLWIDADEEVSAPLRASIERTLTRQAQGAEDHAAYACNRRTQYLGRFVLHGGWYPDRKVRLFDSRRAAFDGRRVHEGLRVDGRVGHLAGDLLHYSFRNLEHHIQKAHEMARLWAEEHAGRRRVTMLEMLLHPLGKGIKSLILRRGFLEGWRGCLLAGMGSYSVWLKYALLRERQERDEAPDPGRDPSPGPARPEEREKE